jgi:hypothetical protein
MGEMLFGHPRPKSKKLRFAIAVNYKIKVLEKPILSDRIAPGQ